MTSHQYSTEELVKTIAESSKVVDHFHLPVQSGSSRVLDLMNRRYTKEHYLHLIHMIRKYMPDAAISTDIIVGFPGETEEDFSETIDLVQKVKFDSAFTFVYSKRTGTPAARMEDPVSLEEKKERLQRLNDALSDMSLINEQPAGYCSESTGGRAPARPMKQRFQAAQPPIKLLFLQANLL